MGRRPGGTFGGHASSTMGSTGATICRHGHHGNSDGFGRPEPSAPMTPSATMIPEPAATAAAASPGMFLPTEISAPEVLCPAAGAGEFPEEVSLLLEMGLVSDREVARDLLR